jgi:hypothetical protein
MNPAAEGVLAASALSDEGARQDVLTGCAAPKASCAASSA